MSVLIKGMEMPTEGYIDVRIKCNGTASFAIADNPYFKAVEAIPVPPHGDLIDRDAMKPYMLNEHYKHRLVFDADEVANAPTIIPAEEGE